MAFARTVATTHTKTLLSPSTGSEDKVYGADYVSASSHTSTGGVSGADVGGLVYCPTATTEATSANLTFNGTALTSGAIQFNGSWSPTGTTGAFHRGGNAAQIEFFSTTPTLRWDQAAMMGVGNFTLQWGNQTNTFSGSSNDTSLSRGAAAVVRVGDGGNNANGKFNASAYQVAGTQVVSAQGASVADASGGATIDAEARTAINSLLARVRVHGLIA